MKIVNITYINLIPVLVMTFLISSCAEDAVDNKGKNFIRTISHGDVGLTINSTDSLLPFEYSSWVLNPSNHLYRKISLEKYDFMLQYESVEYIACRELRSEVVTLKDVNRVISQINGLYHFVYRIIPNSNTQLNSQYILGNDSTKTRINKYASSDAQFDFFIIQNTDTIYCNLYHYEPMRDNISPMAFNLGFDVNTLDLLTPFLFIYNDNLFNNPILEYQFIPEQFDRIPNLKML
jgi:hypothetical protein